MAETLRADPGSYGVTSGVGMHMQKHVYGVWSAAPGTPAGTGSGPSSPLASNGAVLDIVESPEGAATVATYSVLHGRDGGPESALLICDLPDGARCYAKLNGGTEVLAAAESTELIGQRVTVTPKDGINLADLV
jgi:acetyl-CoA C-acetyltransferase